MLRLISIILITFSYSYSQNLPATEQVPGKQEKDKTKKPKFDPSKPYKTITLEFDTKDLRVAYMLEHMARYCMDGKTYSNAYEGLNYGAQLAKVDLNHASQGFLITIKMSDNNVFVFMINNICNFNGEESGEVNLTFFSYKYGEVDKKSIKSYNVTKKRLYPSNNIYTEELIVGKLKFNIENRSTPTKMLFSGKAIELEPYDFMKSSYK